MKPLREHSEEAKTILIESVTSQLRPVKLNRRRQTARKTRGGLWRHFPVQGKTGWVAALSGAAKAKPESVILSNP